MNTYQRNVAWLSMILGAPYASGRTVRVDGSDHPIKSLTVDEDGLVIDGFDLAGGTPSPSGMPIRGGAKVASMRVALDLLDLPSDTLVWAMVDKDGVSSRRPATGFSYRRTVATLLVGSEEVDE